MDGWGQRMSKDHVRIELATLASLRPGGGARHFLSSSGRPGMHDVAQGLRNALPVALAEDPQLAKFTGVVRELRRGPLDDPGCNRGSCFSRCFDCSLVRPFSLQARAYICREDVVGEARSVRWTCRNLPRELICMDAPIFSGEPNCAPLCCDILELLAI